MKSRAFKALALLLSGFQTHAWAADVVAEKREIASAEVSSAIPLVTEDNLFEIRAEQMLPEQPQQQALLLHLNQGMEALFHEDNHLGDTVSYHTPGFGQLDFVISYLAPTEMDNNRLAVQGSVGPLSLGATYIKESGGDFSVREQGYALRAGYQISDYKILAQYQNQDANLGYYRQEVNAAGLGVEHSFSSQARLAVWYSQREFQQAPSQQQVSFSVRYDF